MNARATICTLGGLVVIALILAFTPRPIVTAKGNALPAEKIFPAVSAKNVMIYAQAPQSHYTTVGTVNAEIKFKTVTVQTKEALFQKVKSLAATLGANGVIMNMLVPDDGMEHMLAFYGTAIYTPSHTVRSAN